MEQEQARQSIGNSTLFHDDNSTNESSCSNFNSVGYEQFHPLKPIDVLLGIPKSKSPRFQREQSQAKTDMI